MAAEDPVAAAPVVGPVTTAVDRNRIRRFVLYGSELPLCKCDRILNIVKEKLTKEHCPALVRCAAAGKAADKTAGKGAEEAFKCIKAIVEVSHAFFIAY